MFTSNHGSVVPDDPGESDICMNSSNRRCHSLSRDYDCEKLALQELIDEMNCAKSFSAKIAKENLYDTVNCLTATFEERRRSILPEPTRLTPFSGHAPSVDGLLKPTPYRPGHKAEVFRSQTLDDRSSLKNFVNRESSSSSTYNFSSMDRMKSKLAAERLAVRQQTNHSTTTTLKTQNRRRMANEEEESKSCGTFSVSADDHVPKSLGNYFPLSNIIDDQKVIWKPRENIDFSVDTNAAPTSLSKNHNIDSFDGRTNVGFSRSNLNGCQRYKDSFSARVKSGEAFDYRDDSKICSSAVSLANFPKNGVFNANFVDKKQLKNCPPSKFVNDRCFRSGDSYSSSGHSPGVRVTPSSDCFKSPDFENLLKEKESEMQRLRATMERNERVLQQNFETREIQWESMLHETSKKLENYRITQKTLIDEVQQLKRQNSKLEKDLAFLDADNQKLMIKTRDRDQALQLNDQLKSEMDFLKCEIREMKALLRQRNA